VGSIDAGNEIKNCPTAQTLFRRPKAPAFLDLKRTQKKEDISVTHSGIATAEHSRSFERYAVLINRLVNSSAKELFVKRIVYIIVLLTISVCAAGAQTAGSAHPTNSARTRSLETYFMSGIAAFNEHGLDKFMEQFGDDLELYTPAGRLRGREAVRERFVSTFKQFSGVRMEIEDLKIREVAKNTAIVDFKWTTYPIGRGPVFHGLSSGVYIKRGGKWVEVLEHETITSVDEALKTPNK
jgi:hypothetical protein